MNTTPEDRTEIANLAIRQVLNSFPVVGPILTDVFFTYRNNVRQARLNHFVGMLESEFAKIDIDPESLKNEDSLGLFESVLRKVGDTKSEEKRIAFKNILIRGVEDQKEIDYCEIFSDLLLSISEKELEILVKHKRYQINGNGVLNVSHKLEDELYKFQERTRLGIVDPEIKSVFFYNRTEDDIERELSRVKSLVREYKDDCNSQAFALAEEQYRYFLQNLFSKSLLSDDGVGAIDTRPFEIMSLTNFGVKFLEFIEG